MPNLNKQMIMGNCTKDPEIRHTASGNTVAQVSIAVNEKYNDKERTEFFDVVFFGKLAEIVEKYVKKGMPIYVEGKQEKEKYTDKNGIERISVKCIANSMQMLGKKDDAPVRRDPKPDLKVSDLQDDVPF